MMFLDYLYNLPNATSGIDTIAVETFSAVPSFIPLLLMFVYFTLFLGGISRQKARTGTADYPMWSTVASMATLMISLIFSVIAGILDLSWLVIVVVITIGSGVWLFLDRKQSEF